MFIQLLLLIGFILSLDAFFIKWKYEKKKYKPWCDFSHFFSCSRPFTSAYANLFVIPNSVLGIIFYPLLFVISFYSSFWIFTLSIPMVIISLYLAYVSLFKEKYLCPLCSGVYIVNILIFILSFPY